MQFFIGITATIGMVYFQDLMPTKMGISHYAIQ